MTARPPEHLVHGIDGPVVILTARVCAYLNRYAGLDQYRRSHIGEDAEADNALSAIRWAEMQWRKSATGTGEAVQPEPSAPYGYMSTTRAAELIGLTDRAIRKAIEAGHLKAERIDNRWRIHTIDLEHYKATRTT